jgi:molecular chaperone DnaK
LARDVARNIDTVIKIGSAAVDVKEAKVEQMVSESVEFAFEDMNARVFEESRLKAEELLPAVEVALEQAGSLLTPKEIARIQEARERVEKAIEERKVAELKVSVEQLDEVTESLAAMLVEEATKAIFSNPQD